MHFGLLSAPVGIFVAFLVELWQKISHPNKWTEMSTFEYNIVASMAIESA